MIWLVTSLLFSIQDQQIRESVRVPFVMVDIAAMDRKGRPILDLTADDFEVYENGEPIRPSFFDTLDFRKSGVKETEGEVSQRLIMVFDIDGVEPVRVRDLFKQADQVLASPGFRQHLFFRCYSLQYGGITKKWLQGSEAARFVLDELRDRYRRAASPSHGDGTLLFNSGNQSPQLSFGSRDEGPMNNIADLEVRLLQCRANEADMRYCAQKWVPEFIRQRADETAAALDRLEILAREFDETADGLKTIIFISKGFILERLSSVDDLLRQYNAFGTASLAGFDRQDELREKFRNLVNLLARRRIVFFTFDAGEELRASADRDRRLNTAALDQDLQRRRQNFGDTEFLNIYRSYGRDKAQGLRQLAERSGGVYHRGRALKSKGEKVLHNFSYYYVLGYQPPQEGPEWRDIKVQLKRKRVKLHYRRGYRVGLPRVNGPNGESN